MVTIIRERDVYSVKNYMVHGPTKRRALILASLRVVFSLFFRKHSIIIYTPSIADADDLIRNTRTALRIPEIVSIFPYGSAAAMHMMQVRVVQQKGLKVRTRHSIMRLGCIAYLHIQLKLIMKQVLVIALTRGH